MKLRLIQSIRKASTENGLALTIDEKDGNECTYSLIYIHMPKKSSSVQEEISTSSI